MIKDKQLIADSSSHTCGKPFVVSSPFRVLNLYACLGGNRYKWTDCEVTAVELDAELAKLYQERFPNDKVVVADAHQYLLEHYKEFDFIWTSPPCPSHSRARFWGFGANGKKPIYPDMKLYEEIIFLENHFNGKYVVENVIPYYKPLIEAQERDRHLYWCNFKLPKDLSSRVKNFGDSKNGKTETIESWSEFHDYDFTKYKGEQLQLKIARNLVDYEAGLTIFNTARGIIEKSNVKQPNLFDGVL
ncbi:MAG TPA: class I SAM-dependent methyltransferase [Ferruginibacter sp.]|nr:class I SAM-dependent methyltransferase [Ferruginibacter sp.]HMP20942.1 class I SAM-dependent methyltransferase [Ferruginibacter sp.]